MNELINKEVVQLIRQPLTQSTLKRLLDYKPETGVFTYKVRTGVNNHTGKIAEGSPTGRYARMQIGGKFYSLHRLAFMYMNGEIPEEVDHINGSLRDNRWCNLRAATRQENQWNKATAVNNTVGIKGITWCGHSHFINPRQQYSAKVRYGNGKRLIKSFSVAKYGSKELALKAAENWLKETRTELHKEFTNHGTN